LYGSLVLVAHSLASLVQNLDSPPGTVPDGVLLAIEVLHDDVVAANLGDFDLGLDKNLQALPQVVACPVVDVHAVLLPTRGASYGNSNAVRGADVPNPRCSRRFHSIEATRGGNDAENFAEGGV